MIAVFALAAAVVCPAPASWAKPATHTAARSPAMKFALPANGSSTLTLFPTDKVSLPGYTRKPKPFTFAGLAALDVPKAGKLDVVLSDSAWIDLVRGGKAVASSDHAMTTGCPGMRKRVTFDVSPGRYVVQISEAGAASIRMGTILR